MAPRGICPEDNEGSPEERKRPLERYLEDFRNYRSADLDAELRVVLHELIDAGFAKCFSSERSAIH